MIQTDSPDTCARGKGLHFQLYAPGPGPVVNWRLLSGNNRDMGRGVVGYADVTRCLAGLAGLLRILEELDPLFVTVGNNSWRWCLRHDGETVVSSGRAYDRKARCKEGHAKFVKYAPLAHIRNDVVVSSARRWSRVAIHLGDRVAPT